VFVAQATGVEAKMDLWKLRTLTKPKWMTPAVGLMRDMYMMRVDRGSGPRVTAAADYRTRYWRNTPLLSAPQARSTPRMTTTTRHQTLNATSSTLTLTSASDVKKQSKETRKLPEHTDVVEPAVTSDAGDVIDSTLPQSRSPPSSSPASSTDVIHDTSTTMSDPQRDDYMTSHTTCVTSQESRDDRVITGVDANPHVAEAEAEDFSSKVMTASTTTSQPGEMMSTTYLNDDVTQVRQGPATPEHVALQVTDDDGYTGETRGDEVELTSPNDVTGKTSGYDVTLDVRTKNSTPQSAVVVDEPITTDSGLDRSGSGRPSNTSWTAVNVTETPGGGRVATSPGRDRRLWSSASTSSSMTTVGPSSTADDQFSLVPRRVLLKSDNSTSGGSTVYWSSQST